MKINREAEAAVSPEMLREKFLYTPSTGLLIHRKPKGRGACRVFAMQPAGTINKGGYLVVYVGGQRFYAHRTAYAMATGNWPDGILDHVNQIKTDNRIGNLRVVTKAENANNSGLPSNNTSGFKGVVWSKKYGKWAARIVVGGKQRHLAYCDDIETAAIVRRIAESCIWQGIHTLSDPDEQTAQAA